MSHITFITHWLYLKEGKNNNKESLAPPDTNLKWQRGYTTNHKLTKTVYDPASILTGPSEGRGKRATQAFSHLPRERLPGSVLLPPSSSSLFDLSSQFLTSKLWTNQLRSDDLRLQESWGILSAVWERSSKGSSFKLKETHLAKSRPQKAPSWLWWHISSHHGPL